MGSLQTFSPAITHWSFGITLLVGLTSSEFSAAETLIGIFVAGCISTLSVICSCTTVTTDIEISKHKRVANLLTFLIIWQDIFTNLVAAGTSARLASATVDYISKGHFREFLFGLQQHSLGEPWPDVLGVTIILVVTVLFMMGLEKSAVLSILLFMALFANFASFTFIGSFHTVNSFSSWVAGLKIHSPKGILNAAALCSFAYANRMPMTSKNNCLKLLTIFFIPWLFYTVLAIVFSLMTGYRELNGTAIPLIQVFQNRDVDWARPVIAVCTICVACLLLTEVLPNVYLTFVCLAGKTWKLFISSLQYQSGTTGAPVLAIFGAGSLAAILAFACPLSHLIRLLSATTLIKGILNSFFLVYVRYRPDIIFNESEGSTSTNIQYSKLTQNTNKSTRQVKYTMKDKIKGLFVKTPQYIHKLSSPKGPVCNVRKLPVIKKQMDEQECLLFEEYVNKSINNDMADDSSSENEENEMEVMPRSEDDEHSDSSTDIDVIVEEYREGLRVATIGKFNERKRSTKTTSLIVIICLILICAASVSISLCIFDIVQFFWLDVIGILACVLIITGLPENSSEKSKPCLLPSCLFALCHILSMSVNIITVSIIMPMVWYTVLFWAIAGLILYMRFDCCQCDILEPLVVRATSKVEPEHFTYEFKDSLTDRIVIAR
ncbi:probable cationic amino acid transporter [Anthonomus grandis grandis]|uniref:probable cationic amino acid transporter n=1 Tax=Anthonomus grandis grandis TaxID=2921223 RepID=UPI002166936C|nr:probable cationic amino acid transporter [Anthonomus grandis grandis]XP_050301327.1 probable cationic amino acid transporter [Anthonomus grandis grandis]